MSYQGCDISPFVLPLLRETFEGAAYVERGVRLWRWILGIWGPKLLYVDTSYSMYVVPAVIAARSLGVLTAEQQHGTIGYDHAAYLIPPEISRTSQAPLCDFMVVWGDFVKRLLVDMGVYDPEQVVVCGFPRLDSLVSSKICRQDVLAAIDIPLSTAVVLYASNMIVQDLCSEILTSLQEVSDQPVYWLIKLHPGEKTRHIWEQGIQDRRLKRVRVVVNELDFYDLLAVADLHVSSYPEENFVRVTVKVNSVNLVPSPKAREGATT